MVTREIRSSDWPDFFNGFTCQHRGWLVAVDVYGEEIGAQVGAEGIPLEGITAESSGVQVERITISLGQTRLKHLAHVIAQPTSVRLEETDDGIHEALQIESASGITTLVRFFSPMPYEMVDGCVSGRGSCGARRPPAERGAN